MPQISVIVPVYKVEPFLRRCVDSILNQSLRDFELILVDDGSPDNCGVICDEYAEKDSRIHVIHQENGGLSAARNAGIDWVFDYSDSQWLAFIDSDDWVHKEYLKTLLNAAMKMQTKIATCDMLSTEEQLEDALLLKVDVLCMDSENAYVEHYGKCMSACGKVYHRELFQEVRFPVGRIHEDCYTTHIPIFASGRVAVCDIPLYYYFTNPESITRSQWTLKRLEEIKSHELRLHYLEDRGYKNAYKRELEVYADTLMEHAEILQRISAKDVVKNECFKSLRKKLRWVLKQKNKVGQLTFDRGLICVFIMAYYIFPLWNCYMSIKDFRKCCKNGRN